MHSHGHNVYVFSCYVRLQVRHFLSGPATVEHPAFATNLRTEASQVYNSYNVIVSAVS
jgi:hypothetical protein